MKAQMTTPACGMCSQGLMLGGAPRKVLEKRTVKELKERAKQLKIKGYSSMKKDELIDAIRHKNS